MSAVESIVVTSELCSVVVFTEFSLGLGLHRHVWTNTRPVRRRIAGRLFRVLVYKWRIEGGGFWVPVTVRWVAGSGFGVTVWWIATSGGFGVPVYKRRIESGSFWILVTVRRIPGSFRALVWRIAGCWLWVWWIESGRRPVMIWDVVAVWAADLGVGRIEAAAATLLRVELVRLAVHRAGATLALRRVVHGRLAAPRVRAERTITQLSVAADLARFVFRVGFLAAAVAILSVNDLVAATSRLIAVRTRHDLPLAARLVLRAVDVVAAARRVLVVQPRFHVAVAADVVAVVVRVGAAAASVRPVRPILHVAVATQMGRLVVRVVTAARRVAVVVLGSQPALATDVVVQGVDVAVAAAVRRVVVDLVAAARALRAVVPVDEPLVGTAELRAGVVRLSAAAVRRVVRRRQMVQNAVAALAVSAVVDAAAAAARLVTVLALTHAESAVAAGP